MNAAKLVTNSLAVVMMFSADGAHIAKDKDYMFTVSYARVDGG